MNRYDYKFFWTATDWRPDPGTEWFSQIKSLIPEGVTSVVDLGCGSGRFYPLFHELGLTYTGIDMSPSSIGKAQTEYPEATWILADITDTKLPKADLVFTWVTLQHVWPEKIEALATAIQKSSKWQLMGESLDDGKDWQGHCFKHTYQDLFKLITTETVTGSVALMLAESKK